MDVPKAFLHNLLLITALGALPTLAPAATEDEPTTEVGVELALFSRDLTVTSNLVTESLDIESEGLLPGIHGAIRGTRFHGEVRLLTGDLDADTTFGTTALEPATENVTLVELRGTYGTRVARGRLYAGVGITQHSFSSPSVDWDSYTIYLPFGFSRTTRIADDWNATGTVEGRIIVAGKEDIDTSLGDVGLDQNAGIGIRLAGTFFNHDEAIEIQPYFELMLPGDTDRSDGIRAEELRTLAIGSELNWAF